MLLLLTLAHAIEGMWEPRQLPELAPRLAELGFTGDAAALGRLDAAPLGAVVSTGGCTASFVSADGLLITNHHCVTGYLAQAQKEGENLVADGFYARTRAEERSAGPSARVQVTEGMEDVTDRVIGGLPARLGDTERQRRVEDRIKALVAACEKGRPTHRCRVASFYEGLRYVLVSSRELRDVRVVMAPPDSVGNYGDDIDNWHWPRHAGDFAFLRVYVGPDGKPADHDASNVPYRPPHVLPIGPGVGPGEFVLAAGYSGSTDRWQLAWELRRQAERDMPRAIARGERRMALLEEVVAADPAADAILGAPRGWISNSLFNRKGALEGFARVGVVQTAMARDAALDAWIAADPERTRRYAPALAELREVLARRDATWTRDELMGQIGRADLLGAARTVYRWSRERQKPDARRELGFQQRDLDRVRARMVSMQKTLQLEYDRRLLAELLLEMTRLPADQQVPELVAWMGGSDAASVDRAVERLYRDPALDTAEERVALLDATPAALEASTDGFLSLAVALWPYDEARRAEGKEDAGAMARLRPIRADALRRFDPAAAYPDANGTLRVTVGTVQGYSPRDAVTYAAQTRLEGVAEKAGPPPFAAPPELLEAIRAGKRGPYLDPALGSVPVGFLTDVDTTGGNSGSPTLDAQGRLVGLLFDGNYEGIASDWVFDQARARSIHVDIRYVLWYLDAVSDADPLLTELGVKPSW